MGNVRETTMELYSQLSLEPAVPKTSIYFWNSHMMISFNGVNG
ncbi:hypothetical protein DCCM_3979 [Desulfocucumis palustris]|uniref:Uncharacterized protein n=1 Tax=Desulfocucumis palustris TaxID=1898651 RepID=A0A2L2XER9_9FIRM|nr:hypothetical protein DCCM_3979 [Desulfocucumis palustris]